MEQESVLVAAAELANIADELHLCSNGSHQLCDTEAVLDSNDGSVSVTRKSSNSSQRSDYSTSGESSDATSTIVAENGSDTDSAIGCDATSQLYENLEKLQLSLFGASPPAPLSIDVHMANTADGFTSPLYQENEFELEKPEKPQRSSSLKVRKTPPDTPGKRKEVRFADAFGLDLAMVKTVFNLDSPPRIPPGATKDLQLEKSWPFTKDYSDTGVCRFLQPTFSQPGASSCFLQRVKNHSVCLENAICEKNLLQGTVRVQNLAYHKKIYVRFTMNEWNTFTEVPASYVKDSNNGNSDRFSFTLVLPERALPVGSKVMFCIRYQTGGETYWDNNLGANYSFVCYARTPPSSGDSDASWTNFL